MEKFFKPQSIAIIGASEQKGKIGNILLNNLLNNAYKGQVYPINPKHKEIEGLKCFSRVGEIADKVDLAIIAIPAPFVPQSIKDCGQKKIENIIVISAGFSEAGAEGKKLEKELSSLAKEYNLKIAGPNCLGMINAPAALNLSFSKNNFKAGSIGLIMQSGAFATALFDLSGGENLGFSLVATLGNKAVLDEIEFLEYFAKDPQTKIIGMYLEDIKRGREFMSLLGKVSQQKPVVILKAGNSMKAQKAMLSHTGAMAGEVAVTREAIIDSGGIYIDDLTDFISVLKVLSGYKKPLSNKIAIVTNAGGPGVIITDLVEKQTHISLMELDEKQKAGLKSVLPPASSADNPIDLLGDADQERYGNIFAKLSSLDKLGAALAIVTPQAQTDIAAISKVIADANKDYKFPVYPIILGTQASKTAQDVLHKEGHSNFPFPSGLVNALDKIIDLKKPAIKELKPVINKERQKKAREIFEKTKADKREVFFYEEARELTALYDIPSVGVEELTVENHKTSLTYPVVMKIDSPTLLHKNTKEAVILNIDSDIKRQEAFTKLRKSFLDEKIILQPQMPAGFEIILGLKFDERFGQVLMVGLGGILTEIISQKSLWILPASRKEIEEKLADSPLAKILKKQKMEMAKLIDILENVAAMAIEQPQIQELDINPLIFYANKEPVAVDVKVIIKIQ